MRIKRAPDVAGREDVPSGGQVMSPVGNYTDRRLITVTPMGIVIQRWLAAVTHPIEIGKHVGGGSTQILPPHDRPRR